MTAAELDALEALANAATPGPWVLVTSRVGPASPHHAPKVDHAVMSNGGPIVAFGLHSQRADPRFIAASRDAMPKLIAQVRSLGKQVAILVARAEDLEGCDNLQCQRYRRETNETP